MIKDRLWFNLQKADLDLMIVQRKILFFCKYRMIIETDKMIKIETNQIAIIIITIIPIKIIKEMIVYKISN